MESWKKLLVFLLIVFVLLLIFCSASAYYIQEAYLAVTDEENGLHVVTHDRPLYYLYIFSIVGAVVIAAAIVTIIFFLMGPNSMGAPPGGRTETPENENVMTKANLARRIEEAANIRNQTRTGPIEDIPLGDVSGYSFD